MAPFGDTQDDVDAGRVPVLAPSGFLEHAVSENVYAGTAMGRRAAYMYGAALARGPQGSVGAGLGQTTSTGTVTLIPPTVEIHTTGPRGRHLAAGRLFGNPPGRRRAPAPALPGAVTALR
ncbi:hypothetical protein GCM10023205_82790 [Yinghuangia aomiensis]|uniref:Uncharacterized protein n=1 Tax=Yinghuangia aomiensis TaxID=676205 RepID=A0ABP9IH87_9ACTN